MDITLLATAADIVPLLVGFCAGVVVGVLLAIIARRPRGDADAL